MSPKKRETEPPLVFPLSPNKCWKSSENELLTFDQTNPKVLQFMNKPAGLFPGDYLAYCSLLQIPPHPSIPRAKQNSPFHREVVETDRVEIRNTVMDPTSLEAILISLRPIKSISTLSLFNTSLDWRCLKVLETNLLMTSITNLQLDFNPLQDNSAASQLIQALLGPSSKLINLSLRGNHLSDEPVLVIAESLKQNKTLQSLNLFDNKISDVGASALIQALSFNSQLGNLSLAYNTGISDKIALEFTKAMEQGGCSGLQLVNFSSNSIQIEGAKTLITSLVEMKRQNNGALGALKSLALQRDTLKGPAIDELRQMALELLPEIHVQI